LQPRIIQDVELLTASRVLPPQVVERRYRPSNTTIRLPNSGNAKRLAKISRTDIMSYHSVS
jgi:hypothetical protein